jgi:hypothetical protein
MTLLVRGLALPGRQTSARPSFQDIGQTAKPDSRDEPDKHMTTDAELIFADHAGRFYARQYGFPPVAGRLLGYLIICDPPQRTIADLAKALLASRSAIARCGQASGGISRGAAYPRGR